MEREKYEKPKILKLGYDNEVMGILCSPGASAGAPNCPGGPGADNSCGGGRGVAPTCVQGPSV